MPSRITTRRQSRLFIAEWRERAGLSQKRLAERLGTTDMTVSRWERGTVQLNTAVMDALADVLGIDPTDLYHHPDHPTADALLRQEPQEVRDQVMGIIETLRRRSGTP